jgi:tRNA(Ile2) C34 agmatinyltransferase TiaS
MFTATSTTTPACPVCPGHGVPLGQLGPLRWYRCRDCGIDFNRRKKTTSGSTRGPAGRTS